MRFVANAPALQSGPFLFVADTHVGRELELRRQGVNLPFQHEKAAGRLNVLLRETRASTLVILGDCKHAVTGFEREEQQAVHEFLSAIECEKIVIVKGNHDGGIEALLKTRRNVEVRPATGAVFDTGEDVFGAAHGHALPSPGVLNAPNVLLGHEHPLVAFRDRLQHHHAEPCWLVGQTLENKGAGSAGGTRVIVFPAFSGLAGGNAVNGAVDGSAFLSPAFRKGVVDVAGLEAFSLAGVPLGRVARLPGVPKREKRPARDGATKRF